MAVPLDIFDLSAIALAIMVFMVSVIFMAAQAFKRPEWEAYAKLELYQVFVSVLILVFVIVAADFAYTAANALADTQGKDTFSIAYDYLNGLIFQHTYPAVIKLRSLSLTSQYLGGLYAKFGSTNWGVQFPIMPGMNAVESSIEFLINILSPFLASLIAQQIGLQIIQGSMFTLVLPLGIFLRIFPQTREAGVFLIATAVGFYVVFPLTYVMHSKVISYMMEQGGSDSWWYSTVPEYFGEGSLLQGGPAPDNWWDSVVSEFTSPRSGTGTLGNAAGIGGDAASSIYLTIMRPVFIVLNTLSFTVTQGVFLPALSMIITTSFIKITSKFLSQKFE